MVKIGLISDNHSYFGNEILDNLKDCDEIWHAGDIGDLKSIEKIQSLGKFVAVYGNIDDKDTQYLYPENQIWKCEEVKVFMTHIGGYPGRYNLKAKQIIEKERPNLFICGHSHICKVMKDEKYNLIHINPGAYGHHGFHAIRTIIKFSIDKDKIFDLRAVELGRRGIE